MTNAGKNIKKLRQLARMTIKELSDKSGVGQSTISDLETGKAKEPRFQTLKKVAKVLNTSVEQLTDMEVEFKYVTTDIEKALGLILEQPNLSLHGNILTYEARLQLTNSIKMALKFTEEMQKNTKK